MESQEDPERFLMFPGPGEHGSREQSTRDSPVPERRSDFRQVRRYTLRQDRNPPERYGQ